MTNLNQSLEHSHQVEEEEEEEEEDFADELKFYTQQIYLVIKPVVVCIVLSIFWVKVAFSGQSDYRYDHTSSLFVSKYVVLDRHVQPMPC